MASVLERRVVVTFRASGDDGSTRSFLDRAHALALGLAPFDATHVGWDALAVTFALDAMRLGEALELARRDTRSEDLETPWAIGVAYGDVGTVAAAGSPLLESGLLWWGPPLVAASALAARALPGEILCADGVPETVRAVIDAQEDERSTEPLPLSEDPDSLIEHARIVAPEERALVGAAEPPPDSEPTTLVDALAGTSGAPAELAAAKLRTLAYRALSTGLVDALERWLADMAGTHDEPADALRALRTMRTKLSPRDRRGRVETSLALATAAMALGRPEEALLEALDALARTREVPDAGGSRVCLALLASLYTSVSRHADAARLRGG